MSVNLINRMATGCVLVYSMVCSAGALAQSCPSSHPFSCGNACYTDAAQAQAGGCAVASSSSSSSSSSTLSSSGATSN